ncbi:MAG: YdbC family protein [Planctomycetes bacterium]|nr:YdbC family protein [Planctomycetota bacterium]
MLLKLIRCDVAAERQEAFCNGQSVWDEVAECDGFLNQRGGWLEQQAWLTSWWSDWSSYANFRKETHDHLLARSGHGLACDRIEISYWEDLPNEVVDRRGSPDAAGAPVLTLVELLDLAPGCLPEFREFLTWRWRSALAGAPGLQEARLCRHRKRPGKYLIWSTWSSGARPVSLAGLLQPGFRVPQRRLRLLRSHEAFQISCEAGWQVGADLHGKSAFLTHGES